MQVMATNFLRVCRLCSLKSTSRVTQRNFSITSAVLNVDRDKETHTGQVGGCGGGSRGQSCFLLVVVVEARRGRCI